MYKKAADTHYCAKIFKEEDKCFFFKERFSVGLYRKL